MSKETDHRLPNTVRPEKYTIELRPDVTRFTFQGEESVAIRVFRPVRTIELNAAQWGVTRAALRLPVARGAAAARRLRARPPTYSAPSPDPSRASTGRPGRGRRPASGPSRTGSPTAAGAWRNRSGSSTS